VVQLEVLSTLTANDPDRRHCCIHLEHWFEYRGHVCIVFEKLGVSLYDFMHKNAFRPFPLDVVQHFARQMLRAIAFLHSLSIVHTDLKPENILLVNSSEYVKLDRDRHGRLGCRVPLNPDIRVIDFGSATFEDDRHSTIVSTRHYRAPEVRSR
jgi:dual-specificity kinase